MGRNYLKLLTQCVTFYSLSFFFLSLSVSFFESFLKRTKIVYSQSGCVNDELLDDSQREISSLLLCRRYEKVVPQ